jgi:hypothetical protein
MDTMNSDYSTTRIWTRTLKILRMLHALTGESIVAILHRLAEQELSRVKETEEVSTQK